jgi:outer membrane biogenesis lipoprotein LolB
MKLKYFLAASFALVLVSGCASTQPQQAQSDDSEQKQASTREVRDAARDASSTARDIRSTIYDLKSIFK